MIQYYVLDDSGEAVSHCGGILDIIQQELPSKA